MKYIVCYSGGESSALCAVHCVEKFGKENVILLNHNISSKVEHHDIKRFKQEVADYLGLSITYANADNFEEMTPLRVCRKIGAFISPINHQALCTYNLKTEPFKKWLVENFTKSTSIRNDVRIVYGFNRNETTRVTRRVGELANLGYHCYFPYFDDIKLVNIEKVGIMRPKTYKVFKHANCIGCLKAGMQHWYIVYCLYKQIFNEAIETENELGYNILNENTSMESLIPRYEEMIRKGICPNEVGNSATFWARVDLILPEQQSFLPCDCAL